jgi:hypothetical protein
VRETELQRVQGDLATIRQAVGLGPPALAIAHVWGFLWLAFTGLLLVALTLFPGAVPPPWGGLLVLTCWIALPVRGLLGRLIGSPNGDFEISQRALPRFYSLTVVAFGVVVVLWARLLGLSWSVTVGMLFFIEALPLLMVSVGESWRRAGLGIVLALVVCGLGFPFVQGSAIGLLLGGAIFCGCSLSAGILYWQLSRHAFSAATR